MAYEKSKFEVEIDEAYTAEQREAIAAEIISYVRTRTLSGKDMNNKSFKGYSKGYIRSTDFKAANKSKGQVNLRLSGDMLAYMELVKNQTGKLVIGYGDENPQAGKAEGNHIGSYGKTANSKNARPFLGIDPKTLSGILAKYPIDDRAKLQARTEGVLKAQEEVEEFTEKVQVEGLEETDYKLLKDKLRLKIGG